MRRRVAALTLAGALTPAIAPPPAVAPAGPGQPTSCSTTYTRAAFRARARHIMRSPVRLNRTRGHPLHRMIACAASGRSAALMRRHLARERAWRRAHVWDLRAARIPAGLRQVLEAIASCESGGDPTAISPGGTYRGKYQFDYTTWGGAGGSGDPAAASEGEQDVRAAILYRARGAQPWPVCGH